MPIEKGVPIPPKKSEQKYPFNKMAVGDSFTTNDKRVRAAASAYGKRHGQTFVVRKDMAGGLRCWRTA